MAGSEIFTFQNYGKEESTMIGITSCGACILAYRINRGLFQEVWGGPKLPGEKAVANFDEDAITMGVEAALNCLEGEKKDDIEGLFFASTTSPYKEKMGSSTIAAATDLKEDILTSDLAHSTRVGTIALSGAIQAVKSVSARKALVIGSDCRLATPQSQSERIFGDGAAALTIGNEGVVAEFLDSYSISDEFTDVWRVDKDDFPRVWEERFTLAHGYMNNMNKCIAGLLKKADIKPEQLSKALLYAPDPRSHAGLVKAFGFNSGQVEDPVFLNAGNTGAAFSLMMLVGALETAKPGDIILMANYGYGADAFLFKVTEEIEKLKADKGIKSLLSRKIPLTSYAKFLRFCNLLEKEAIRREEMPTSLPVLWRQRREIFALKGNKCRKCGTIHFPKQRVCASCRAKDDFEEVDFSHRKGKVFTFNIDELALSEDPPTVLTIVNFDGGGRLSCVMTDRDPEQVHIGMPVEMTFRRMNFSEGIYNYFWKSRPVVGEGV